MTYELDEDTALAPRGEGTYAGELTRRWDVGGGMNGGYLAAFCLRAVLAESAHEDPLAMNVHYLSRPEAGAGEVQVAALRKGRGHSTFRFELVQGDDIRCAGIVTCGRLREAGRLDFQTAQPELPPPEQCPKIRRSEPSGPLALWDRLETRAISPDTIFSRRTSPGEARTGGWTRLADGRPTDALAVALFLDSWPPAVFSRTLHPDPGGVPTLEYTVHFRNRPRSDWLYASFETRTFAGGYVDEHGVVYDRSGRLVGESRQLARYSIP